MAGSDIKISSLTAVGGVGQIVISALATAPLGMTCLPYMQPASIRIRMATSASNFAGSSVVGTVNSSVGVLVLGDLPANTNRYFWAIPVDSNGNEGERYPAGNGVGGTTLSTQPGPNSVGPNELQADAVQVQHIANLAVTNAKIKDLAANKLTAGTITAKIEIIGPTVTGGLLRTGAGQERVELNAIQNELAVYNGAGKKVVRLGYTPDGNRSGILSIISDTTDKVPVYVEGINSGGYGIWVVKALTGVGVLSEVFGNSSDTNAVYGRNVQGGVGILGVSNANGGYGVYASKGGYGPFTGAHDALISKEVAAVPGDIVFDRRVMVRGGWGDTLTEVGVTNEVGQCGVVGVIDSRMPFDAMSEIAAYPPPKDRRSRRQILNGTGQRPVPSRQRVRWAENYDRLKINALGEGQMNVCGRGGDVECGDLICASDLTGKGQRQHDDIVRGWTVAKVREDVTFDHPDQVKIVAVIYLCG